MILIKPASSNLRPGAGVGARNRCAWRDSGALFDALHLSASMGRGLAEEDASDATVAVDNFGNKTFSTL